MLQLIAPDNLQTRCCIDSFGSGVGTLNFRYAGGTGAAPTPPTISMPIGFIGFNGYAAGNWTSARANITVSTT